MGSRRRLKSEDMLRNTIDTLIGPSKLSDHINYCGPTIVISDMWTTTHGQPMLADIRDCSIFHGQPTSAEIGGHAPKYHRYINRAVQIIGPHKLLWSDKSKVISMLNNIINIMYLYRQVQPIGVQWCFFELWLDHNGLTPHCSWSNNCICAQTMVHVLVGGPISHNVVL